MNAINSALVAALLFFALVPASAQTFQGVTCDDVRHLSPAEQNYWSARLNLSAEQRHRIYVACYQNQFGRHDHNIGPTANIVR